MSEQTRTALVDGDTVLTLRKFSIEVTRPDGSQEVFPFRSRETIIGTSHDADLSLDDRQISRRHCQIEVDAHGYRLRDFGSKNGTFIGDLRINDVYLASGMTWRVGSHQLKFRLGDEEVQIRLSGRDRFSGLIGKSSSMRELFAILARVAPTNATVLVEGESGTGKELVASAVHEQSPRASGPFVVFDCSAIPHDLVESELFGHIRGAFTGAHNTRKGAFERANGGTLFLDELGELALDLQPKLLRALDSGRIRPVGSAETIQCDVRVVAATNRNLKQEIAEGNFREDLYYRLAVIQVRLPPLRRRPEDIPLLAQHFLDLHAHSGQPLQISFSTMEKLKRHRWPGNVRELKNFVERAVVLAEGDRVETRFLKLGKSSDTTNPDGDMPAGVSGKLEIDEDIPFKDAKSRLVEAFETAYWRRLLERTGGNVSQAARIAGVHRKSVEYILKKLDIRRSDLS